MSDSITEGKEKYCVVTFFTTNYAIDFEKKIKAEGIDAKLIPVPRSLSSSCGLAAKVDCDLRERILQICSDKKVEIDGFHELEITKKKSFLDKFFK